MNLPMRNRILLAASVLLASLPLAGAELVEKIVARVNDRLITNSEFEARFATEDACRAYLVQLRWPDGFRCPRCRQSG